MRRKSTAIFALAILLLLLTTASCNGETTPGVSKWGEAVWDEASWQ